ncbi:hypothetical protein UA08_04192 [Talaromyces atroroseus]|uniref:N-acetyltransferase domain-containing protein n=1 Tax=Talaromyces atroroseus TaxID=1441469 RepID=A0A1Q5Q894_TALAT|nr:hypothetical protein UA08_04192 [Talaromyces atroroseus]OKL60331.1 hypothetical protein UA08_04192 [Talaromyces atroroseus]
MAALNKNLRDAFKSERLVYKALEDSKDDQAFFLQVVSDPVHQSLARTHPRMPAGHKKADEMIKILLGGIMSVKICLSPTESRRFKEKSAEPHGKTDGTAKEEGQEEVLIPIGFVTILNRHEHSVYVAQHRNATLGISLVEEFRGKGYGGEAINWALDWAFFAAGLHRVSLECFSFNTNAYKLYKKLGFVEEGRQREVMYYERGWHDAILFSMLEQEWEKLRDLK